MHPLTLTTTMGVYRDVTRSVRTEDGWDDDVTGARECIEVTVAGTVERHEGEDPRLEVTGLGYAALFHPHLILSDRERDDAETALCDEYERAEKAERSAA